jgi:hypothetical protein
MRVMQILVVTVIAVMALLIASVPAQALLPPPDKQTQVNSPTASTDPLTNPADVATLQPAGLDTGSPTDIMQVKNDLVSDRQTEQAILGLPQAPAGLQAFLSQVDAASVLDQRTASAAAAMADAYADPTYQPYVDNAFTVDQWQGVQISGTSAFVLLMAHDSYKNVDGTWDDDISRQWQVKLSLENGRWKLVSHNEVDPADAPESQPGQNLPEQP